MERTNKMATGLLIGLVVGTVVGAMASPNSGRENRAALQEKIGQINDKVRKNRRGFRAEMEGSLASDDADRLP